MHTIFEDEIISIEEIEPRLLKDIQVGGNKLFFANNILTHNSQLNRSSSELPPEELTEERLADSYKKMFIADNLVAWIARAEDRKVGRMYAKSLKARDGLKDVILAHKIDYSRLTISDSYSKETGVDENEED